LSGALACPSELEAEDCEQALDYFGFPSLKIEIDKTDAHCVAKMISYSHFRKAMDAAPKIVEWIKEELLTTASPSGMHFIADNGTPKMNQFAQVVDVLLDNYSAEPAVAKRLGTSYKLPTAQIFPLLGGDSKACRALRQAVLAGVREFGGLQVEWQNKHLPVKDVGEYGNVEYRRESRHVLKISIDPERGNPEEGIKRRKTT